MAQGERGRGWSTRGERCAACTASTLHQLETLYFLADMGNRLAVFFSFGMFIENSVKIESRMQLI